MIAFIFFRGFVPNVVGTEMYTRVPSVSMNQYRLRSISHILVLLNDTFSVSYIY